LSYEGTEAWWGNTAQLNLGSTAQHSVTPHYNACDFAEAKRIKHISTDLQNKQAKIGWLYFLKEIQQLC
jgi:hypothetical protein